MANDPLAAYRRVAIQAGFIILVGLIVILILVLTGVLKEVPLGW